MCGCDEEKKKIDVKKIGECQYEVAPQGDMKVPVRLFTSPLLLEKIKTDKSISQAMNAATIPGLVKASIMMPDAHQGYGLSVGGVVAYDAEHGVISPGQVGFDINCGVRLLATPLDVDVVQEKIEELLEVLFKNVPSGVGSESKIRLTREELDEVLTTGANWCVKNDYAFPEDLDVTESNGCLSDADAEKIPPRAKKRGKNQLSTLGAGNHFLEVQIVDQIYNEETAKAFGIDRKGQIVVMIHCGSRGLGHQTCSDFIRRFEEEFPEIVKSLPDKDLIYAPAETDAAKDYYKAMCAGANFAWANRQCIAHNVRKSFHEVFGVNPRDIKQVYDVAHNIVKLEEYEVDGVTKKVYVHRKGATRCFPPGHPEIIDHYRAVGQPVLIPGSMGTASYVLVGTPDAMQKTFGSTAHGAGRVMSRRAANNQFNGEEVAASLRKRNIYVKAASRRGICEEAPGVYKDIDEVIKATEGAGIAKKIVRLVPLGVVKG